MMTTPTTNLLPLSRAAELFDAGESPSYDTLLGWISRGYSVRGQRIRLRAIRIGRRWMLDESIIRRFGEEVAAASVGDPPEARALARLPSGRARRQRAAEIEAARARNRQRGIEN